MVPAKNKYADRYVAENKEVPVLLFEKGVLLFEKGVLLLEKGVLLFENGVL